MITAPQRIRISMTSPFKWRVPRVWRMAQKRIALVFLVNDLSTILVFFVRVTIQVRHSGRKQVNSMMERGKRENGILRDRLTAESRITIENLVGRRVRYVYGRARPRPLNCSPCGFYLFKHKVFSA